MENIRQYCRGRKSEHTVRTGCPVIDPLCLHSICHFSVLFAMDRKPHTRLAEKQSKIKTRSMEATGRRASGSDAEKRSSLAALKKKVN